MQRQVRVRYGPLEWIALFVIVGMASLLLIQNFRPDLWQAMAGTPKITIAPQPTAAVQAPPQAQPIVAPAVEPVMAEPIANPTDIAAAQKSDAGDYQEQTKPNRRILPTLEPQYHTNEAPAVSVSPDQEGTKPARHRLP